MKKVKNKWCSVVSSILSDLPMIHISKVTLHHIISHLKLMIHLLSLSNKCPPGTCHEQLESFDQLLWFHKTVEGVWIWDLLTSHICQFWIWLKWRNIKELLPKLICNKPAKETNSFMWILLYQVCLVFFALFWLLRQLCA